MNRITIPVDAATVREIEARTVAKQRAQEDIDLIARVLLGSVDVDRSQYTVAFDGAALVLTPKESR